MKIEIAELNADHEATYKTLLLKGLAIDADCFRITPEDERSAPFPTTGKIDSFTLGAFTNNSLVGVASFQREGENRQKLRHKGILFRIYVDHDYRKLGIASNLIQEVIDRSRRIPDIEKINLTVIPTNQSAKSLYEKFGFKTFASEKKAIKWKGRYFAEDQMKLIL